jgi:hypothetical protein
MSYIGYGHRNCDEPENLGHTFLLLLLFKVCLNVL